MKPPARAVLSQGWKQGNVFPDTIRGTRLPSNSCWPNREDICVKLTYSGPFGIKLSASEKSNDLLAQLNVKENKSFILFFLATNLKKKKKFASTCKV